MFLLRFLQIAQSMSALSPPQGDSVRQARLRAREREELGRTPWRSRDGQRRPACSVASAAPSRGCSKCRGRGLVGGGGQGGTWAGPGLGHAVEPCAHSGGCSVLSRAAQPPRVCSCCVTAADPRNARRRLQLASPALFRSVSRVWMWPPREQSQTHPWAGAGCLPQSWRPGVGTGATGPILAAVPHEAACVPAKLGRGRRKEGTGREVGGLRDLLAQGGGRPQAGLHPQAVQPQFLGAAPAIQAQD